MWNSSNGQFTTPKEIYSRVILSGTTADTIYINANVIDKSYGNSFIVNLSADTRSNRDFQLRLTGNTQNFQNGDLIYLSINMTNTYTVSPGPGSNTLTYRILQDDINNSYSLLTSVFPNTTPNQYSFSIVSAPLIYYNVYLATGLDSVEATRGSDSSTILSPFTT